MLMKTDDVMGVCWVQESPGIGFMGNIQTSEATNSTTGQFLNLACGSEGGCITTLCPFGVQYGFNNPSGQGREARSSGIFTLYPGSGNLGKLHKYDSFAEYLRPSSSTNRAFVPPESLWPGYGGGVTTTSGKGVYTWGTGIDTWPGFSRNHDVIMFNGFSNTIPGVRSNANECMTPLVGWRNGSRDAVATVCIHFTGYKSMNTEILTNSGMHVAALNGLRYNSPTSKLQINSSSSSVGPGVLCYQNWIWTSTANGTKPVIPARDGYGVAGYPTLMVNDTGSTYEYFLIAYIRLAKRGTYASLPGDDYDTCHTLTMPSFAWKSGFPSREIKICDSWIVINPVVS